MSGHVALLLALAVAACPAAYGESCRGCVSLDEVSFEKVVPKYEAVLVKFDVAFPYGDKHETFGRLSEETARAKELLLGEIGVKDYGERDNEPLAKRYGVTKDDYPTVKLFKKDVADPVTFPKSKEFTLDNLRTFIRDNTDIYLGLPGCLEPYDRLVKVFLAAENTIDVLNEAIKLSESLDETDSKSAKTYVTIMKKIIENGQKFIRTETDRVTKLLSGKLTPKKQREIQEKLNILRAFAVPPKDEL